MSLPRQNKSGATLCCVRSDLWGSRFEKQKSPTINSCSSCITSRADRIITVEEQHTHLFSGFGSLQPKSSRTPCLCCSDTQFWWVLRNLFIYKPMCLSYHAYKHSMDLPNLLCETKIPFIFSTPRDVTGITWICLKAKVGLKFIKVNSISRIL